MTRAQREMLVERYMEFEMTAGEENDFIMQAATDAELLRTLHAYRMVQRSLSNSSRATLAGADPGEHAAAIALLAAHRKPEPAADADRSSRAARPRTPASPRFVRSTAIAVLFALLGFVAGLYSRPGIEMAAGPAREEQETIERTATEISTVRPADRNNSNNAPPAPLSVQGDRNGRGEAPSTPNRNRAVPHVGPSTSAAPPDTRTSQRPSPAKSAQQVPRSTTSPAPSRADGEPITVEKDRDTVTFKARGLRPDVKR